MRIHQMGLLLTLALIPWSLLAQTPASHEKGLSSNTAYQLGDLDSINLFNGNLVLRIPIGQTYPVTPSFAYGLNLTYNANGWDYRDDRTCVFDGSVQRYVVPRQDPHTNSGWGWQLQIGQLYPPGIEDFTGNNGWRYISPDGADHGLGVELHPGHPATPHLDTYYSTSGTYMRLRHYETGATNLCDLNSGSSRTACVTLEFPDGLIHEFRNFANSSPLPIWRVTKMSDRFGNFVDVEYLTDPDRWQLTDQHGRVQTITFTNGNVSKVDLSAFGNQTATYSFEYTTKSIDRQRYFPPACATGADETPKLNVETLSRLVLPDGSFYEMDYNLTDSFTDQLSGAINKLRVPTGGGFSWTYQPIDMLSTREPNEFPDFDWSEIAHGVASKSIYEDIDDPAIGTWTYDYTSVGNPTAPQDRIVPCFHNVTVNDPLGNETVNYFASSQQWGWEYALPFTHCDPHASGAPFAVEGPFLSQEIYDGSAETGTKLRSVWVRYGMGSKNINPEPLLRRVVYHDDGDRYRQIENLDADGFGHFRKVIESGNFNGEESRTSETDFHLETGTMRWQLGGEAPDSTFVMPSRDAPWIWTTFTEQRITEGSQTATRQFCFDRSTGFLERQRVLAGTSRAAKDLITVFESDLDGLRETGQVGRELSFGGDGGGLTTGADLCNLSLPATPSYEVAHTYENGALETSAWIDCDGTEIIKTVDQDIDAKTGMARTSRDSSGVAVSFVYDTMGRLTSERPTSSAWTNTEYELPTISSPNQTPQITVTQCPNGQATCLFSQRLAWQQSVYDGLGRTVEESIQMPDLPAGAIKTSTRRHTYNALGWKLTESSWDVFNQTTKFENHDPFGRVGTIRPPGANPPTNFTYQGERATTRQLWIQTNIDGTRSQSYSTEVLDSFGRLVEVCENRGSAWSGSCTGGLLTSYEYDEGDRLTKVCQNNSSAGCGQERFFTYDNRGFLLSERHPEIGKGGNGWTNYTYDARGNVLTRKIVGGLNFDLDYRYDRAGRLVRINETARDRPLKEFYFARSNSGINRKAGKLVLAKRYNYIDILPPLPSRSNGKFPVVISDAYEYRGRDGRTSKHQMRYQLGVTSYLFDSAYTWDSQGNLDNLTYPNCLQEPCAGRAPPRTINHDYERGFLRKVTGFADLISYQAGGMLHRVPHENGVSDWIDLAGDGLARPSEIRTQGVASGNWNSGAYIYDGAQNITNIGPLPFSYDLMSRLKSGDVGLNINNTQIRRQIATYDAYGNIQNLTTGGSPQNISADASNNRLSLADYDEAGNLTSQTLSNIDHAYGFDPLNMMKHLRTSNDVSRIFVYNSNDQRVLTFDCAANVCANDNAKETWTLRGLDGKVLRQYTHPWSGGWHFDHDTIYRDGQLLANIDDAGTVHHLHLDHLGSPRQVTDATGNQIAFHSYYPFGQEATNSSQTDFALKFTGHERDENGGGVARQLDYMMARFCSPSMGRFLSVDPVLGRAEIPQSWNRYAYVINNPNNLIDPTGKTIELVMDTPSGEPFQIFIGALKEAGASREEIESLQAVKRNGVFVLRAHGLDFSKSSNPTVRLIGEAMATDATIQVGIGSVPKKLGGGKTDTTFFDSQKFIKITLDPDQIESLLVPGKIISGPLEGTPVALPVSLPTALVHELGHAYGNFAGRQPGRGGHTAPDSMKAENNHRRLGPIPAIRTIHCGLYPGACE